MKKKINVLLFAAIILMGGLFFSCETKDPVATGSVTGVIINSQTGYGLEYVAVGLSKNASILSIDEADFTAITDAYGYYTMDEVPVGTYICIISSDGYFVRTVANVVVKEGTNELDPQTLVLQPEAGSLRILLTWDLNPLDLDSHLTGPASDGQSRFHMSFMDQTPDINIDLDVDDVESYGPETTTIHSFMNGTYRFSVFNYSNQLETGASEIPVSPTKVEVYNASGLLNTFIAPAFSGYGNTWRVCEIIASGSSVTVVPVNTYIMAAGSEDISSF